jgi:lipopolysaccharide/colanic/teichoic acid biosynthesis glycosyltransferase
LVVFNRTALSNFDTAIPLARTGLDPLVSDIVYLGDVVCNDTAEIPSTFERIKRGFDIVFAGVALLILSPIILAATILIKLESAGSIFYKQERIGLNRRSEDRRGAKASGYTGPDRRESNDRRKKIHAGKPFNIYKLRTMRMDAEKAGPTLSSKNDPRITKIGHLLRRTRIDELPQFINVLQGDMSIVGPRPERSFFINQVRQEVPEFPLRLKVKPGITGLAQVEDGYTETVEQMTGKLYYDLKYIVGLSIAQEIKILFKTIYVVISGKGAC